MKQKQLMNSIERTFARAQAENLGVSRHFIRMAVLNGSLPSIRAGKKYLINWEHFIRYLNATQTISVVDDQSGIVRPVSDRPLPLAQRQ